MQNWTLVFDLDGTLVDSAPDLAAATNHVLEGLGLTTLDEMEIRPFAGHGALVMIDKATASHGLKLEGQALYDQFDVFIKYYNAHIADMSRPYDGIVAALETAMQRGAKLAVCTNKNELQARSLLNILDMARFFSAIAGRDSLGVSKPNPGHLTGTIALADGSVERAVMIGDSETDIKTAKAAGVPIVAVDFGYSTEPVATFSPDAIISRYADLIPVLERLTGCCSGAAA